MIPNRNKDLDEDFEYCGNSDTDDKINRLRLIYMENTHLNTIQISNTWHHVNRQLYNSKNLPEVSAGMEKII